MRCAHWVLSPDKDTQTVHSLTNTQQNKMTKTVMLSMLAQGNTGDEILSILDALTADNVSEVAVNEPTLNEIEF